jgi:hypothetical protein
MMSNKEFGAIVREYMDLSFSRMYRKLNDNKEARFQELQTILDNIS